MFLFLFRAKRLDFTLGFTLVLTLAGLRVVVVVGAGATNSSISSTYSNTSSGNDVLTGIYGLILLRGLSVVPKNAFCCS